MALQFRMSVLALVLASGLAGAQNRGDAVLTVQSGNTTHFLAVSPSGPTATFLSLGGTSFVDGMTVSPGNRGALFVESGRILEVLDGGTVITAAPLPASFIRVPSLEVDAAGDFLILSAVGNTRGVYRMPRFNPTLTTLAHNNVNASFSGPLAMTEDLLTGDLLVFDFAQRLHRVRPDGTVTTVSLPIPSVLGRSVFLNAHADPATGLVHFTYVNFFMRVDAGTGAITTLERAGANGEEFFGVDNDPFAGGYYLSVRHNAATDHIMRYDVQRASLSTVATLPASASGQLVDLVTWKSRMLSGQTRPATGSLYAVGLSVPGQAGYPYLAAAALGIRRGIPIGGGRRVPLDPDALFFLSQQAPGVFIRFQGRLDGNGLASLVVIIPPLPQLAGLRFFLAAVTTDRIGISVITEPLGVTIE